ncbi:MAG: hypothetical protein Q4A15_02050 [Prevotellaceae bacterium]|nr:hypothetical protein [Prevotellaceae bacterium]
MKTTKYNAIKEYLYSLNDDELVNVHNAYCDNYGCMDDYIFNMEDIEDILYGTDKWELLRMAFYGNFNPNDDYFGFNGYGNLISFGYAENLHGYISFEDLADYAVNNDCMLEDTTIYEILSLEEDENCMIEWEE